MMAEFNFNELSKYMYLLIYEWNLNFEFASSKSDEVTNALAIRIEVQGLTEETLRRCIWIGQK